MAEESKLADKLQDVTSKKVNPEDPTKFTPEEVETAKRIRQTYADVQYTFGQIGIARLRLEQQLEGLDDVEGQLKQKFTETQKEEQDYIAGIQKKYGDGTLDPESGIFTPNKVKAPK
tara:strand:+ start:1031 stop:1381 length:351 start_codon:yes stop_codon:yes gene_type:complete